MLDATRIEQLPDALLPWYASGHRDLPWRADREPYHVWISEIMLQQTRVEAVRGYYARFLAVLPTVQALAVCDDDVLHKLWEGLGYYSRVRNLKKAAQIIVTRYGGEFPRAYSDILALPGIGAYTAGAIASIAFGQKTPAVDGNVLRVIARICDDATPIDLPAHKQAVTRALASVYPEQASDFTQALMELGATICGPNRKPECDTCPCAHFCLAHKNGTAQALPIKLPKRQRREEDKTVFILRCGDRYALEKRPSDGLLAGLWQFPNCEGKLSTAQAIEKVEAFSLTPRDILREVEKKHIFTHITWHMRGIYLEVATCGGDFTWMSADEIRKTAALPTAFRQFWDAPADQQ